MMVVPIAKLMQGIFVKTSLQSVPLFVETGFLKDLRLVMIRMYFPKTAVLKSAR